ncbi:MAG: hypothetical protein GXO80_09235 [Chlorobi bacterium]|nr:hypothetical protein [Chlorobiota bacterium]
MRFFILSIALFFNVQLSCAQNTLTAELSLPTQISNNKNFTVTLTIKKPENLHSFAVFTQKIPNGFFVNPKILNGANFSVKDNLLTIRWLRLSGKNSVTVSYTISYLKGLSGVYSLSGNLNYLIGNKKGEYKLKKYRFSIIPENLTTVKNLDNYSINYETYQNVKCVRKIMPQPDKSYLTEIKISNLPKKIQCIIVEEISSDFEIQSSRSANVTITENKRLIQFNKVNSGNNKSILLSYLLIPKQRNETKTPVIFGKISFIKNGQIINLPIENLP